jgi:hypothetical protein
MSRRRALWILAGALTGLAGALGGGCGYTLRSSLPAHIKTIHVPVLENRTQEPAIESFVTQALTEAVVTSGRAQLASSERVADAVLEGSIIEYTLTSLAFDRAANVTQYRLTIALSLTLRDRVRNEVIWRQERIQDRADFRVAGPVTVTLAREDAALRRAAVDVSRAIVSLAFEGF